MREGRRNRKGRKSARGLYKHSRHSQRTTLLKKLNKHFPTHPIPIKVLDDDSRSVAEFSEKILQREVKGNAWTKISSELIEDMSDLGSLIRIEPKAFAYYFPAFLRRAILEPYLSSISKTLYFMFSGYGRSRMRAMILFLTPSQIKLAEKCFRFLEKHFPDEFDKDLIQNRPKPLMLIQRE